ncbi:MAG: DUF4417 domain-containing protein [Sphaerochaeta sp.]|nr:DUF4417 domain-containing protein [uncultured Sphaerochaeta sp.]
MSRKITKDRQAPYITRNHVSMINPWDIPILKRMPVPSFINLGVVSYDNTKPNDPSRNKIVHFFIDDYKFETTYTYPERCVPKLAQYTHVLTPDFSLYTDYPLTLQLMNTFKNRWCGAFWQELGLSVIPTITWASVESFDFCFKGVEKGSVVAISTNGCRACKKSFLLGYKEMLRQIEPERVLCFGKPFKEMESNTIFINYSRFSHKEVESWEEEEPALGIFQQNN